MLSKSKLPNPIRGYAGKFVGVVPFQTRYDLTLRMTEQFLQAQIKGFFGLETEDLSIPLKELRAVKLGQGCTWWLFWLGFPFILFWGLGVIGIVLAFIIKQRYLMIYTTSEVIILFYEKGEKIAPFKTAVLEAMQPATSPSNSLLDKRPPPPPKFDAE